MKRVLVTVLAVAVLLGCARPPSSPAATSPGPAIAALQTLERTPAPPAVVTATLSNAAQAPQTALPPGAGLRATPFPLGTLTLPLPTPIQLVTTPLVAQNVGRLLYLCNDSLCLADANGANAVQVTAQDQGGSYQMPAWAPGGGSFVVVYMPHLIPQVYPVLQAFPASSAGWVVMFDDKGHPRGAFSPGDRYLLAWAHPRWSPDGSFLSFIAVNDENRDGLAGPEELRQLWILDSTTMQPAAPPLDGGTTGELDQAWSPDSRKLAYIRERGDTMTGQDNAEVQVYDRETRQSTFVTRGHDPAWQPQENVLTFVSASRDRLQTWERSGQITTLLAVTSITAFLATEDPWVPSGTLEFNRPVWSPANSAVAFHVWGNADKSWPTYIPAMMFSILQDGTGLVRWPDTDVPNTGMQNWSPQGNSFAYPHWMVGDGRYYPDTRTPSPNPRFTYKGPVGLIVADLLSGAWREESSALTLDLEPAAAWSSDGEWLAFPDPKFDLQIVSTRDPSQRWSVTGVQAQQPQWEPVQ